MNAIAVENLSIEYEDQTVVEAVNFEIRPGEFVFVIGKNGSGKSTLVKAILGLVPYQEGKIDIFGEGHNQDVVASYIGYVPQYTTIERDFPITVEEMIDLECQAKGHCDVDIHQHLAFLNSQHLRKRRISELSGGEFQKTLIARALVINPQILILDEPLNSLDTQTEEELLRLLEDLHKAGTTVILISHDHNMIKDKKHKIILVENQSVKFIQSTHIH